ncbi:hypothetical protein LguiB_025778 [Lonicera macranthoides]
MEEANPLNLCHVQKKSLIINRTQTLLHAIALLLLIYYRSSYLLQTEKTTIPLTLVFISELILSFIWLLGQSFGWRPVLRTVFPERLPEDKLLPAVDVFICTADPNKEPTVEVMNTVISALGLDYPANKLRVYVSDDGGSCVTLSAIKEAWRFTKCWLPFCRRFGLNCRCPEAYFAGLDDDDDADYDDEFIDEKTRVQNEYEVFLKRVMAIRGSDESTTVNKDHSAVVEVINEISNDTSISNPHQEEMPLLVYIAREKRPSFLHHFKAGALNVLVSL